MDIRSTIHTTGKSNMIDFTAQLRDLSGEGIIERTLDAKNMERMKPLTLGAVAANALLAQTEEDKSMTGEEKVRRYSLAMKVVTNAEAALKAEEVAEIKKVVAKAYGPLVVGQAWKLLDPQS